MSAPNETAEEVRGPVDEPTSKPSQVAQDEQAKRDANALMLSGAGIGVFGAVSAVIGGAVCPVCVVAAPALLGIGAFRRWRTSRARATSR